VNPDSKLYWLLKFVGWQFRKVVLYI